MYEKLKCRNNNVFLILKIISHSLIDELFYIFCLFYKVLDKSMLCCSIALNFLFYSIFLRKSDFKRLKAYLNFISLQITSLVM